MTRVCCCFASVSSVAHYPEGKQGWMEAGLPVEKAALKNHFES
jgi:hypothetical protein